MNFENILPSITSSEILEKISEYDIFKRYCSNFKEIDVSFFSDLRITDTENCRIFITHGNELKYRDFKLGETLSCFQYVMKKFNCTYFEALSIISVDFNIKSGIISIEPRIITANDEFKLKVANNIPREKSIINIISQPWNSIDYNYWSSYKIPFNLLDEYNVYSAKTVFLIKGNKRIIFEYKKNNPCYAYRFTRDGGYSYKIYWPLTKDKKFKWLFSGGAQSDLEGIDCLPLTNKLLIITKSLKDVMVLNLLGYNSISLQGEANKLENDLYIKLSKRFNKIISFYDNDKAGEEGANYLLRTYNIDKIFIPLETNCKDISDYVKLNNLEEGRKLMNKIIKNDKIRAF